MLRKYLMLLFCGFIANLYLTLCHANTKPLTSIAFYYGNNLPTNELKAFDVAVVIPNEDIDPNSYNTEESQLFAYVTIGETDKGAPYSGLPQQCIIGRNKAWEANIVDQRNTICRKYYLDKIITPLWKRGYKGIFLDTLDSYRIPIKNEKARADYAKGLEKLIASIKKRFPKIKIILNRGFELLPKIHKDVYAVAAESLYRGWNQAQRKDVAVPPNDRSWLLGQFNKAKKYGLPVISIDYLPLSATKEQMRILAQKISTHGIIPWVTDGSLQSMGVGVIEPIPRTILAIYDGKTTASVNESGIQQFAAMPLNHMGYIIKFLDARKFVANNETLKGKYVGILMWLGSNYLEQNPKLQNWLIEQIQSHIPLVILDDLRTQLSPQFKKALGITIDENITTSKKVTITKQTKSVGYDTEPLPTVYNFTALKVRNSQPQLQIKTNNGDISNAVAITPWGGYAINPFIVTELPNGQTRWVINPFAFFRKAFRLPLIPIPDVTTENGLRFMMAHIDGDGYVSKGEWHNASFAGDIMLKEILEKYKIPTTVSVIQAEVMQNGLYTKQSTQLEATVRKIFALPWVEIASHSFSHPFNWHLAEKSDPTDVAKNKSYYLPVKNYIFNINTEITGSINYINKNLAPANKKCKVFLWTGDTDPSAAAVALTYKNNVRNMDGGNTTITNAQNSIANIGALGIYKGKYFQVYAPIQNENIYTDLWTGPFYGFKRVIETLKLTDKPVRYKPIDIYYHFYSATKVASLSALKAVYDWSLKQDVFNIYVSEYADKVLDFNNLSIARLGNSWLIRNHGDLREFRLPITTVPDFAHSTNIVGYRRINNEIYIHLGAKKTTTLKTTTEATNTPYIVATNAVVSEFDRQDEQVQFKLQGHLPINLTLANVQNKTLNCNNKEIIGKPITLNKKHYILPGITKVTCVIK